MENYAQDECRNSSEPNTRSFGMVQGQNPQDFHSRFVTVDSLLTHYFRYDIKYWVASNGFARKETKTVPSIVKVVGDYMKINLIFPLYTEHY